MNEIPGTIPTTPPNRNTNPTGGLFLPSPITKVEDTGLGILWLQDLTLKILYFQGYLTGLKIAEALACRLPEPWTKSWRV
jgi:hypothetical protein